LLLARGVWDGLSLRQLVPVKLWTTPLPNLTQLSHVSRVMEVICSACPPLHSGSRDVTTFPFSLLSLTTAVYLSPSTLTSGWHAPKFSTLGVHPSGFASKSTLEDLHISFNPPADYGMIAEAAGAWSKQIKTVSEIEPTLREAVKIVQSGQCAVLNVFVKD
jgi:hypothetical protein